MWRTSEQPKRPSMATCAVELHPATSDNGKLFLRVVSFGVLQRLRAPSAQSSAIIGNQSEIFDRAAQQGLGEGWPCVRKVGSLLAGRVPPAEKRRTPCGRGNWQQQQSAAEARTCNPSVSFTSNCNASLRKSPPPPPPDAPLAPPPSCPIPLPIPEPYAGGGAPLPRGFPPAWLPPMLPTSWPPAATCPCA